MNTAKLPRRIDSIVRRKPYQQLCKERRMQMAQLFCSGMCFKKIGAIFNTRPDNVSYGINKVMHDNGLKTHAQLGIWMMRKGYYVDPTPSISRPEQFSGLVNA
jgi:DNA-binding NarL/FixJ family response regulator